jgi:putative tryptophan/tyrosine transport system substrate-binding protein
MSLIVATGGTVSARAAKEATATIPILFIVGPNPIDDGLVTSLNRPGGNATGVALYTSDLLPKRLELLEKLLPHAARIAVLVNPSDAAHELETKYIEDAMRVTGQQNPLRPSRRPPRCPTDRLCGADEGSRHRGNGDG